MTREIRQLPEQEDRVETGPIQFGDDWPGVFIRGDNAAYYAFEIRQYLAAIERNDIETAEILRISLGYVATLLSSSVVGPAREMFDNDAQMKN